MSLISLVTCTFNRPSDVKRLLDSLVAQTNQSFELVLVDQASDPNFEAILNPYRSRGLKIKYLQINSRVLSHCRNLGLKSCVGDIIAFPDDDCWYPDDVIQKVNDFFSSNSFDILSGKAKDPSNDRELISSFPKTNTVFKISNAFSIGMSVTYFFKKSVLDKISFSENLGAGTALGSGEETDFIMTALKAEFSGIYRPDLVVFHPYPDLIPTLELVLKNRKYALGFGYVVGKHFSIVLIPHVLRTMIVRPLGGVILAIFNPMVRKNRFGIFLGRWHGFFLGVLSRFS